MPVVIPARTDSCSFSPPRVRLSDRHVLPSFLAAAGFCFVTVLYLAAIDPGVRHWFLVPVTACGVLIGTDAVDWLRGRLDVFSPIGIVGLLGVHFFFLAPLLHVHLNLWMKYVVPPPDWLPWLGAMAGINFVGLLAYRLGRKAARRRAVSLKLASWRVSRRFVPIALGMLFITGLFQVLIYAHYGGVMGYITAFTGRTGGFRGMGWVFMISESFPILAFMLFAVWARGKRDARSWFVLLLALVCFFVVAFLFGGLRGSRSNTVWKLFWAVGIIHLWLRPFPRKLVVLGTGFLVLFMYLYGFYKNAGMDALRAFQGPQARATLERRTGRTLDSTLLGDLGRADVQAFLLYRLLSPETSYKLAWGRTYLGALAILIPHSIWPGRPPTKVKQGTDALYGEGAYASGLRASRVYGLAGEAMLNFGPLFVPVAFLLWGLLVGHLAGFISRLDPSDCRLLLAPFLVNLCFVMLIGDSDNIVFLLVKNGAVPVLLLVLSAQKIRAARRQRRVNQAPALRLHVRRELAG